IYSKTGQIMLAKDFMIAKGTKMCFTYSSLCVFILFPKKGCTSQNLKESIEISLGPFLAGLFQISGIREIEYHRSDACLSRFDGPAVGTPFLWLDGDHGKPIERP